MNVFDYFFKDTKNLEKDFVIGNKETISYKELYNNSLKIASFLNKNVGVDKNIVLINQNSVFFITRIFYIKQYPSLLFIMILYLIIPYNYNNTIITAPVFKLLYCAVILRFPVTDGAV